MNLQLKSAILLLLSIVITPSIYAKIKLPALVGNHMVLQQSTTVNIWGWASPNETVIINAEWQEEPLQVITANDSIWKAQIQTPIAGGPYSITLKGENTIILTDIMIGEVWLCSGQSNMEKPIGEQHGQKPVFNAEKEIAEADYPSIRLFPVPNKKTAIPQTDINSSWIVCTPKSIDSTKFSAAGYFFGRELHKQLNVPIGLIDASWGGTLIEPWTPLEGFKKYPDLDSIYQLAQHVNNSMNKRYPTLLYRGMIAPLTNFTIKGVIWYQGETNLMNLNDGLHYEHKLGALIYGWRTEWHNPEMPFYYVQLAPYRYFKNKLKYTKSPYELPLLREAQTNCLKIKNTGMIVTTDLVDDLDDIHPRNKQDVGERLAYIALAKSYHKDIPYSGPKYKAMKIKKNKIVLSFDFANGGLKSNDGQTLTCFTIAGENKKFVPAQTTINGKKLIIYSNEIQNPVAVRFAWKEEACPNFVNSDGLPAIPFRTDNWNN